MPDCLRNLPVPFFSQRQNDFIYVSHYTAKEAEALGDLSLSGKEYKVSMDCRTCNITSVMMVMKYFGLTGIERIVDGDKFTTPKTPKEFLINFFDRKYDFLFPDKSKPSYSVDCLESWTNLRNIGEYVFGAECTYTGNSDKNVTMKNLKTEISKGFPACITIRIESSKQGGHVVVVRGFTKIDSVEYVILNDPWGSISDVDYNVYTESGKTSLGSNFYGRTNDSGTDGDNVIVKLEDFRQKLIMANGTYSSSNDETSYFFNFMAIHSNLWNFPDGTNDFSADTRQASIYSKVKHLNGGYPFNKNNVWHTGMHLGIDGDIHSIGPGRLVAVRNSNIDKDIADKSFILLEHQFEKNESIKYFYSLYMHLSPLDLKNELKNYFEKKEEPTVFWLKQILDKILPCYNVLPNYNNDEVEEEGLINQQYKNIKLYPVTINQDGILIRNSTPDGDRYLGRRMLVKPLPIKNQKIYEKLLDPKYYNDSDFLRDMRSSDIYKYGGYTYFWLDKKLYATNYDSFQYGKIFKKQFLTTAKQIYNLFSEKVVCFGEVKKYSDGEVTKIEDDLESLSSTWEKTILTQLDGISHEVGFKEFDFSSINDVIELCSYASSISCVRNELKKIESSLVNSIDKHQKLLEKKLSDYYAHLVALNEEKNSINNESTNFNSSKFYIQQYCTELIKYINSKSVLINLDSAYTDINNNLKAWAIVKEHFIEDVKKSGIKSLEKFSIYINLYIWLLKLELKDFFKTDDTSSKSLNDAINSSIVEIFTELKESYKNVFALYSENDIEIGKNEIIGKCGKYESINLNSKGKEISKIEPQIHFEIFSEEKNILGLEKVYEDTDEDLLYNPKIIIENNKNLIKEEADKISVEIKYLDDNMLLIKELDDLYKKTSNSFLSDFALHIKSQWGEKENKIKYKFYKKKYELLNSDEKKSNRKKLIEYDDFYEKVIKPFMWFTPDVFYKKHFKDGTAWYYHPLSFIEKLAEEGKM